MYVRYAFDFYGDYAPEKPNRVLDGGLITLGSSDLNDFSKSHSLVTEENFIVNNNTVNNFRAHLLVHRLYATPTFTGQAVSRPSYSWGQQQQSPQKFPRNRITLTDALLMTRGRHDLNIGGEWTYGYYGFDAHHNEGGQWLFQTDVPFDRANPATYPFQFTIRNHGNYEHRATQLAGYISDTYRVHPRWTLNLGVRWDFDTNLRDNKIIDSMLADPQFKGMEKFVSSGKDRGNQWDAFQPRLGATWDIRGNGTLVARGGYGIYITRNRQWFSVSSQQVNYGASVLFTDRTKLGQCYPSISCVLDNKSVTDFVAGSGLRALSLIDDNYEFPYQRTASAGIGWQVTRTTSLDMDVVHSYMPNALGGADLNLPASGAITAANPRPVATLGRVTVQNLPISQSWYDALEMQVRQRVRGGASLQASYTLSRSLIDGVGRESTLRSLQRASLAQLDATGKSMEYGYNPIDNRHNLAISVSVPVPGGIQISAIGRAISGEPVSANAGLDLDGDTINVDRPVGLGPTVGRGDTDKQLSIINAYRATLNLAPLTKDAIAVKPPAKSIDLRLTKSVDLGQGRRVELFAEAFNLTNFVNVTGGASNIRLATFNVPTGAQDARQMQWGARFSF
jgi:hypothetical protein